MRQYSHWSTQWEQRTKVLILPERKSFTGEWFLSSILKRGRASRQWEENVLEGTPGNTAGGQKREGAGDELGGVGGKHSVEGEGRGVPHGQGTRTKISDTHQAYTFPSHQQFTLPKPSSLLSHSSPSPHSLTPSINKYLLPARRWGSTHNAATSERICLPPWS